ncbi:MAG: hypothetical protein ACREWG_14125 [Gammaproteobacteria bacterium]
MLAEPDRMAAGLSVRLELGPSLVVPKTRAASFVLDGSEMD